MRQIHDIHGGIHPPERKALSRPGELEPAPIPPVLVLPLRQHLGAPALPIVNIGDRVLGGQTIAEAQGVMSVPVHAPTSGTVTAIEARPIAHASGLQDQCIVIETDGQDEWLSFTGITEWRALDAAELVEHVRDAGIAGMGGAGFPTAVKLNPGPTRSIETLLVNGTECEPYITADDTLMQCQADELIEGAQILAHIVSAESILIGIEDNKPDAIASVEAAIARSGAEIELATFPTKYPSGGEKQIIEILTGQQVPSGGIPADIGLVCVNPGTAVAAVISEDPLPSDYPLPRLRVRDSREALGLIEHARRGDAAREVETFGITGTNGKSTTTALTAHVLTEAGKQVEVGGNLGFTALDLAPLGADGIYVLELSSYQTELTPNLHCATAVLLNITPDHLERHGGIDGLERVDGGGVGEVDILAVVMLEPGNTPRAFWRTIGIIAEIGFAIPSTRSTGGVACNVGVKPQILGIGTGRREGRSGLASISSPREPRAGQPCHPRRAGVEFGFVPHIFLCSQ